jgi:hypothetical protein
LQLGSSTKPPHQRSRLPRRYLRETHQLRLKPCHQPLLKVKVKLLQTQLQMQYPKEVVLQRPHQLRLLMPCLRAPALLLHKQPQLRLQTLLLS